MAALHSLLFTCTFRGSAAASVARPARLHAAALHRYTHDHEQLLHWLLLKSMLLISWQRGQLTHTVPIIIWKTDDSANDIKLLAELVMPIQMWSQMWVPSHLKPRLHLLCISVQPSVAHSLLPAGAHHSWAGPTGSSAQYSVWVLSFRTAGPSVLHNNNTVQTASHYVHVKPEQNMYRTFLWDELGHLNKRRLSCRLLGSAWTPRVSWSAAEEDGTFVEAAWRWNVHLWISNDLSLSACIKHRPPSESVTK